MAACTTRERREAVRIAKNSDGNPFLNGIDFLEVSPADQRVLTVTFLHDLSVAALTKANFAILGGVRITGIEVVSAAPAAANQIVVKVNQVGDFSPYLLRLANAPAAFDPQLSEIEFSFRIDCPSPFDCKPLDVCPPEPGEAIDINYLAKDYASFRGVLLDRLSLSMPDWQERNPADLGIALVELLAYAGDYLSYQQDAISTEAYLGTARRRTSVRRHARLVDYRMHDGNNASAWLQVRVKNDIAALGAGKTLQFLTKLAAQPVVIPPDSPVVGAATVFESVGSVPALHVKHNRIPFYTWSAKRWCLPKGAVSATLDGDYPALQPGEVLILVEVRGPETGSPSDADPTHRHAVRLTKVITGQTDPLTTLPVTQIEWQAADALPFPLCLAWDIAGVSVALGNIVLVDHGRTTATEDLGAVPDRGFPRFRPRLKESPLTFVEDVPAVLQLTGVLNGIPSDWTFAPDMLSGVLDSNARVFTTEVEGDGVAYLRFGDDEHGERPPAGTAFHARYRVGNGAAGNVGAGSIAHLIGLFTGIEAIGNPLPAAGGVEPESIEHVRQSAPYAFRTQERAVTAADYAEVAQRHAGIQKAAATFRWTGSWYTVFLTVDRLGGLDLDAAFKKDLLRHMEKYRMAGTDLEIEKARTVPLAVSMHVCVARDYFRADVRSALLESFTNRVLADGRLGVFHPDNFTLGSRFYLSPLYAAAQSVDGVESVRVKTFERADHPGGDGLKNGYLDAHRTEVFTLDNDPNFPERGTFDLALDGGK